MNATAAPTFNPPAADRYLSGLALAFVVHGLILAGLVWNVRFSSDDAPSVAAAELWSSVPQIAAPRAEAPPPPPPVPRARVEPPAPPPEDTARLRRDADIAVAQQKAKDAEREEQRKADAAARARAAADLAAQKARRLQAEQAADAERKRAEAAAKPKPDPQQARREQEALERQRQETLRRITGMAGATGDAGATGSAMRSAGFSASYGGRIAARIKPNVVFPDALQGNPAVEVELRMGPDGHITSRRITKPSGVAEWDQAVLRALDKTEVLPQDEQGRVPPTITLIFRPKDLGA